MALLDQSTVLITGASSGLGAEFARQIAPRASCLILSARRKDRLSSLAAGLQREGLTVHCVPVDLSDRASVEEFITEVRSLGIRPTVIINNAGLGDHGLFEEGDWQRIEAMIDVNVAALTHVTHAFVKDLISAGRGGILNVSSIASLLPVPQMTVYAATKAYVTSFSEALRCELRGTGVSVMALCPGPVDTEFFAIAERPGSDGSQSAPATMKVSAGQVVREGLAALEGDRARLIPGWKVFLVMAAAAAAPMFIKRFFLNRRGRGYHGH